MKMDVNTEERIDKYILGQMSLEEKTLFESDLKENADLKNEYEAQKEVADGVQRLALRDFLVECEEERAAKPHIEIVGLRSTIDTIKEKIELFVSSGKRVAWSLSSAVAAIVAIIGGIDYSHMSNAIQAAAPSVYALTQVAIARDGNEIMTMLSTAYTYIGEEQIEMAESILSQIDEKLQAILDTPVLTDDDKVNHEEALEQMQDCEWYSAIILMKQGKVIRARKALTRIAEEDGIHADEAREILINTYQFKTINSK